MDMHQNFQTESVFIRPVFVDGGFTYSGRRGNRVHAGRSDTLIGKKSQRRFQYFLMSALA
jgi:hypothetical protein